MKKLLLTLVGGVLCCLNLMAADYEVTATRSYSPNLKTSTWSAITANDGTYMQGSSQSPKIAEGAGLYFEVYGSKTTLAGDEQLNVKSGNTMYLEVPSSTSAGSITFISANANATRYIELSSGEKMNMQTSGSSANFVASDLVVINKKNYVKLSSTSDFKFKSVSVTLTSSDVYSFATNISTIASKSQVTEAKKWDFSKLTTSCDLYTTLRNIADDDTYWGQLNSNNQIQSKQTASTNHALTIDGTVEVDATEGLLFNGGTFGFDFNQHRLRCFSSDGKVIIPNLLVGDQIVLVGARNSTNASTRGFEFTNCDITEHKSADGASWTAVPTLTVTTSGDVAIACKGGVNITSIEVIPGPGTGAAKLTLADDKEYKYDVDFTGNVTINRTFAADGWYSLCLPFDLDDVSMFSEVAEFDEQVGNTYKFKTASAIVAGKPYIVQVDAKLANPVFEGVTISKNVEADASADFKGALNPTEVAAGCAGIGSGTTVNPLTAGTLKGFRAYFQSASSIKASAFVVDDNVTSTNAVEAAKKIVDGKFLINGKMFIMKNGKAYNAAGIEE